MLRRMILGLILCAPLTATVNAQEQQAEKKAPGQAKSEASKAAASKAETSKPSPEMVKRYERFEKLLSGSKLVGQFTILGRDSAPPKEEYEINSVKKLPEGDFWQFNARIKYGKTNILVPMRLEVKWAGDTPMITLTDFTIPGLGTFSSRVMFYKNKYAGTWTHGKVGGHMFGVIERIEKKEDAE